MLAVQIKWTGLPRGVCSYIVECPCLPITVVAVCLMFSANTSRLREADVRASKEEQAQPSPVLAQAQQFKC